MISNLIYYGISLGLGILGSFYYWEKVERKRWMINSAICIPLVLLMILARFDLKELSSISNIAHLLNIERYMQYHLGKGFVALGIVAMFEAFFLFGSIWIEKNIAQNKKN